MALGRFCSVVVLAGCLLGTSTSSGFSAKDSPQTTSGLPVPRYVSLKSDHVNVRAGPTSAVVARLQAGVVTQVKRCAAGWCHVAGNGFDGWLEQQRLWGVYADEKVE